MLPSCLCDFQLINDRIHRNNIYYTSHKRYPDEFPLMPISTEIVKIKAFFGAEEAL